MFGYLANAVPLAKALLVVAPLMADEPRVSLDTLLSEGFQVQTAIRGDAVTLLLQKGPLLYGCLVPEAMLAMAAQPAGEIPSHDILCAPFR